VFAATSDGSITVTNTSSAPTAVTVMLSGWITKPAVGVARMAPANASLGSVSTAKASTLPAKVPARATAALLSVTTKGGKKGGGLTLWGAGDKPAGRSVDVRPKRANSELVMVALGEDKVIRVAGNAKGGTASVRLIGVVR
jgi:hypothetical protein